MINQLQNQITTNKYLLPLHFLYYPIGVARAVTHLTDQIFLRIFGHYIYSPEQCRQNLKNAQYNFGLVLDDYHKWKCRFVFRDFFVIPISNIPKNYDDYSAAKRQKDVLIKDIRENIEKDTHAPLRSGGFNHLGKPNKGCCKVLTEYLSYCFLKDPSFFLRKIEEYKNGVSAELAAKQYTCVWFSRDCPSISAEALSRVMLKVKSKVVGRIGGFEKGQSKLDNLVTDPKTYIISFEAYDVGNQHQIQMHMTGTHTFIVDPNIGLLFCKNARKMELLTKVIENYAFEGLTKREIRVDSLELIENPADYNWCVSSEGFQTYNFEKNQKLLS